jgi:hypothetical protein
MSEMPGREFFLGFLADYPPWLTCVNSQSLCESQFQESQLSRQTYAHNRMCGGVIIIMDSKDNAV